MEILMAVALTGLVFVGAVAMFGDMRLKMQEHQLESAARHFMADCRMVQQGNMFTIPENNIDGEKILNHLLIFSGFDGDNYSIGAQISDISAKHYYFQDMGCKGVYLSKMNDAIRFTTLGSVKEYAYIRMKHQDNDDLEIVLNLQPVTGRIEIEK